MKPRTYHLIIGLFLTCLLTHHSFAQCPEGFVGRPVNLVKNGDFSQGRDAFSSEYTYHPFDLYPEGLYSIAKSPSQRHPDFIATGDHTSGKGKMMVVNGAVVSSRVVWQQEVKVEPNMLYDFSAWFMTVSPASNPAFLDLIIDEKVVASIQVPYQTHQWLQYAGHWISPKDANEVTIAIVNRNTVAGGNDFAIDDIELHPCVPVFAALPQDKSDELYGQHCLKSLNMSERCLDLLTVESRDDFFK